jgi:hypothetical protein
VNACVSRETELSKVVSVALSNLPTVLSPKSISSNRGRKLLFQCRLSNSAANRREDALSKGRPQKIEPMIQFCQGYSCAFAKNFGFWIAFQITDGALLAYSHGFHTVSVHA